MFYRIPSWILIFFLLGCVNRQKEGSLFVMLNPAETGIDFVNSVSYSEEYNVYTYRSFYNGGGVGVGDFNNDGLPDVYLTGNMVSNRLYINQGNFQFKDVTAAAGVSCGNSWSTGVSIVDINADGLLDIYVCKSGQPGGNKRANELFINKGNLVFVEQAKDYGLDIEGLSTHAAFFDYDHDGDLDCYLLTNSFRSIGGFDLRKDQRLIPDPDGGGNKLFKNSGGKFVDVSAFAGIYRSQIGFGLGVTIGDFNNDGWEDIYVSNDFFEKDYLYVNRQNGTFKEDLESFMPEISLGSMGADFADIDNDGKGELFVSEMLPADNARNKSKASFESWDKFQSNLASGYHRQFSRNTLQYNRGSAKFSEISRLSGVEATDWSWGGLIVDLNNDGHKDIFVANGIYKDLLDQDYINFMADPATARRIFKKENGVLKELIDQIPSTPISNYAFSNRGNLLFVDSARKWGLDTPGFSTGAAYADFDQDGDMDMIVNNVNSPCFVYRNECDKRIKSNYVKLFLRGDDANSFCLGTSVSVFCSGVAFTQDVNPYRGFQSSVDTKLNFGLGKLDKIDSIEVKWNTGNRTVLKQVPVNRMITIEEKKSKKIPLSQSKEVDVLFRDVTSKLGINHVHKENEFSDFNNDRLLFKMISTEGPRLCVADINGDHQNDFFIGGAVGQPGYVFVRNKDSYEETTQKALEVDWVSEDTGSVFFDADGDGDIDLFVCSGGNEYPSNSQALKNRLYLNVKGTFYKKSDAIPFEQFANTSCAIPIDYDRDGDLDLFVGSRSLPMLYGIAPNSYLLQNDGTGKFLDVTEKIAPSLIGVGMVTDVALADLNKDGFLDLILVGDFMPVTVLFGSRTGFNQQPKVKQQFQSTNGWWNSVEAADLDKDGNIDLILGNQGLNNRFNASIEQPITLFVNDFDKNGKVEHFLCAHDGDVSYPLVLRNDLLSQIPSLKKKYLKFVDYENESMQNLFSEEQISSAIQLQAFEFRSIIFFNKGKSTFEKKVMPIEAQFAPIYAIYVDDFNKDGFSDIIVGGNLSSVKPQLGSNDGSYGLVLVGGISASFKAISLHESGIIIKGEIRDIRKLDETKIIIAKNNGAVQVFEF